MKDNKVAEWGATVSVAQYTLFRKDNFFNDIALQKSNKIRSYSTSYYLEDGTWLRSLDGGAGQWGYGATPLGGNEFEQPLPNKVQVTYLDELSNQYYQGEYNLPTDEIYKLMTSTNKKRHESTFINANYHDIALAFAPDGWVIVFVTGWPGRKEVGSFQATPINPDPKTYEGEPVSSADESLYIDYYSFYLKIKETGDNNRYDDFKVSNPELYKQWKSGELKISSDWYKKMQTKYPWNLSVEIDGQEWNGEYYAEFVNTERFAVLDDQFDKYDTELKAVPHKIDTWVIDQETGKRTQVGVHLYPRPKWIAPDERFGYQTYYKDPNAEYFFKRFEYLYPELSLATNNQAVSSDNFATLKLHFDKDLVLKEAYIQKGSQRLPIEGAYQFSKLPTDSDRKYSTKHAQPHQRFITEPKMKDLSDPVFVDIE